MTKKKSFFLSVICVWSDGDDYGLCSSCWWCVVLRLMCMCFNVCTHTHTQARTKSTKERCHSKIYEKHFRFVRRATEFPYSRTFPSILMSVCAPTVCDSAHLLSIYFGSLGSLLPPLLLSIYTDTCACVSVYFATVGKICAHSSRFSHTWTHTNGCVVYLLGKHVLCRPYTDGAKMK